jgi:hypothetical protein
VENLVSTLASKWSGRKDLPPHERKAIWQSKICREAQRTMPEAEYTAWLEAFANDDPEAKAIAEQIDARLKAARSRGAA